MKILKSLLFALVLAQSRVAMPSQGNLTVCCLLGCCCGMLFTRACANEDYDRLRIHIEEVQRLLNTEKTKHVIALKKIEDGSFNLGYKAGSQDNPRPAIMKSTPPPPYHALESLHRLSAPGGPPQEDMLGQKNKDQ